jgi:hypothetical protein
MIFENEQMGSFTCLVVTTQTYLSKRYSTVLVTGLNTKLHYSVLYIENTQKSEYFVTNVKLTTDFLKRTKHGLKRETKKHKWRAQKAFDLLKQFP